MEKITEKIAEFICATRYEDIPPEVVAVGKLHILDTLGTLIAGSREEVTEIVKGYIQSQGCGHESTVLTQPIKTSPAYAAFGNGILAHVLDFDDYEVPSMAHPSVTVLPAVLALGEKLNAPGRTCLEAYLAGMEVISKIGRGMHPTHYDKGWHSTGTLGTLGAASASSKLLGLNADTTKIALGIAASMAGGLRANFGTMTKAFHAGQAARNGVEAAVLASRGFTASKDVLESDLGYCTIFTEGKKYEPQKITDGLGSPFSILSPGVGIKPYPSCAATHSFLEGIFSLIDKHDIHTEEVERIDCGISYRLPGMLIYANPRTGLEGKFSLEFCIALALLKRKVSIGHFTDALVKDRDVQALIKRIRKEVTEEAGGKDTPYPIAIINVQLKDGARYPCRVEKRKGSPVNPLSAEEVTCKFQDCAQLVYSAEQSCRLLEAVMEIEKTDSIEEVIRLF